MEECTRRFFLYDEWALNAGAGNDFIVEYQKIIDRDSESPYQYQEWMKETKALQRQ
ncbi:hypothetical protein [Paenibacillus sp. sgz500958]|uniref:hypothetical protein n=1 Tax=Paenibacillus sp. sgz500958 TaxID=3242475 RepID=UPI0036D25CB4